MRLPGPITSGCLTADNPSYHSILNALFKRLLGNPKCEKLSHTGSEVWTVPHSKLASLEEKLISLGIKFALLREDWNHILRRNKAPMSREQKEALARAKEFTRWSASASCARQRRLWRNMP